jgi:ectoine hydroxylase-related dioxygenase (phytanoyl-CoA dioxygenase family)
LLQSQRVCFFDDSYFIKQAGSDIPAPWHHDFTYYEIEGEILVSWIPLDVHGEHETLRLVAGSHRWGKRFAPIDFDPQRDPADAEEFSKFYDPIPDIDAGEFEILSWQVEPGDCVFFNGLTLHSSRGNPTQRTQRRFNCRFVDESATYLPRPGYPWGDGKTNADLQPGQRLSEDAEHFPVLWEANSTRP